jgi:hypothetical protein
MQFPRLESLASGHALKASEVIHTLFGSDIAVMGLLVALVHIYTIPAVDRQLIAFITGTPNGTDISARVVAVMGTGRGVGVAYTDCGAYM